MEMPDDFGVLGHRYEMTVVIRPNRPQSQS